MEEAGILEKITRSGFCYPALNQVNEIPPLRGWQKPLQDPTPVERARTVTRMAGVLNHAYVFRFWQKFGALSFRRKLL
jgi:hypothetical protein